MASVTWWTYLVEGADGAIYAGVTTDPPRRVDEHNGVPGTGGRGARWARGRRPVRLVWVAPQASRAAAQQLEHQLKRMSHQQKRTITGR